MKEIDQLKNFILSERSENAKNHLVFSIFQKLFGNKFKRESDAQNADTYIEGKLLVELKSGSENYIEGFYQALHYSKKGLSYSTICVIAYKFIGLWKINKIPDFAKKLPSQSDSQKSSSEIGAINSKKTSKAQRIEILKSTDFKILPFDFEVIFEKDNSTELFEFVQILKNIDAERIQVNTHNFISCIAQLKRFFNTPLNAIHFFYAIVGYWIINSKVSSLGESDNILVTDNTYEKYK